MKNINRQNLKNLWNEWKILIDKIVPQNNKYYTLTNGINNELAQKQKVIKADIVIPNELIEFYKIYNVKSNSIFSVFSFTINEMWYEIIPFENIKKEWENIKELEFENDYINPKWIPFAITDQGDYLLYNTATNNKEIFGQIIELQNESWERNIIANSIEEILQMQIEQIKKGEPKDFFEFVLKNSYKTQNETINFPTLKIAKFKDVCHLFPEDTIIIKYWENSNPSSNEKMDIVVLQGDITIENLDLDNPEKSFGIEKLENLYSIVIVGNLSAKNIFNNNDDGSCGLLILGNLSAENIVVGGQEIYVSGNLFVKDLFWGHYNHGCTKVKNEITGKLFLLTEEYNLEKTDDKSKLNIDFFYSEEYEDFNYDEIEDRETIIEYLKENKNVLEIFFANHLAQKKVAVTDDYREVPSIFENKIFLSKDDMDTQTNNFLKVFELYDEKYYDEVKITLYDETLVFVNKPNKKEFADKQIEQSIYFLMPNGNEILVRIAKINPIKKLFKNSIGIEVLYKNLKQNISSYNPIFNVQNEIENFTLIWQEFLINFERSVYYFDKLKSIATPQKIRDIINLAVVQEKYNDWNVANKIKWDNNIFYAFNFSEKNKVTVRLAENVNDDLIQYYFSAYVENDFVDFNLWSLDGSISFYENRKAIRFLDYQYFKRAIELFTEAKEKMIEDNEDYLKQKEKEQKQINKQKIYALNKRKNYKVKKPFESIEFQGITFVLKDRKEASEILKDCKDFEGNKIYDTFDMPYEDSSQEDNQSFFLVVENELNIENLILEPYPEDYEELYILGYIFTKPLKIGQYIEAYDTDFSPPIICLDEAQINTLMLTGTTHYFHKNLKANVIQGEYNHGRLIVKGRTYTNLIIADDFSMEFFEVLMIVSISDQDKNIQIFNYLKELLMENEMNYLLATHKIENCIKDEFIFMDEETNEYKFLGGFWDSNREIPKERSGFYELLRKGVNLLDENKLREKYQIFMNNAPNITKKIFTNNQKLTQLEKGKTYYEYPNEDYTHRFYFYQETNTHYYIGYWNTWCNLSVVICFEKSDNQKEDNIFLYYWDKENENLRYSYSAKIDENTYHKNIGQRVFFEAIEQLEISKI